MCNIVDHLKVCNWLIKNGLDLSECSKLLSSIESGNSFSKSLLNVFDERKKEQGSTIGKLYSSGYGNSLTP